MTNAFRPPSAADGHGPSPYAGRRIVLATLHDKARALAPAFDALGVRVVVADVDTDALGTFSGEIPRRGTALDTAIAKARLGMTATGLPLGLATEGSFGPDPSIGFFPLHRELAVLVDDLHGQVVCESLHTHDTNHAGGSYAPGHRPTAADLARWGFPAHALMVRSEPSWPGARVRKGLRDHAALDAAIADCAAVAPEGWVRVETDMRAHCNPTRMRHIAVLGQRLVERLRLRCPACGAPGFGRVDVRPGLPCADCGIPTRNVLSEIHGCGACGARRESPRVDGLRHADPATCDLCNP
jgi:hypothetical protein